MKVVRSMSGLKIFDIEVDVDDCARLYDYGRQEELRRPSGGWDRDDLKSRTNLSDEVREDMDKKHAVHTMDRQGKHKDILYTL